MASIKYWKDREEADLKGISLNELYKRRKIVKLTKIFILLTLGLCIGSLFI